MAKKVALNKCRMAGITHDDVPQHDDDVAKPIGDVLKISGEGSHLKNHYKAFEFNGDTYELGDTVLFAPESQGQLVKPYVAMIKDITKTENKEIMLSAQWFYRPEDVTPRKSKNMESLGARELFFSFHTDVVPAEAIIHKCTVHFITTQNHIPARKEYPGFIVEKVYNPNSKRLSKLTSNSFSHDIQQEINQLVQETMRNLNIILGNEISQGSSTDHEDHIV